MNLGRMEKYVLHAFMIVVRVVLVTFALRFFVFDVGTVSGVSMLPVLKPGQLFLVWKLPYFFQSPQRFDIVQLMSPDNDQNLLVKRVIGLPGDRFTFRDDGVCIQRPNSPEVCINEAYLPPDTLTKQRVGLSSSFVIPDGGYFVLGDNRVVSFDSRSFGFVPRRLIFGKVIGL